MNKPVTRTNTAWYHLHEVSKVVTFLETKYNGDFQGLGEGKMGIVVQEIKNFSFAR